jgi:hypothetical protein
LPVDTVPRFLTCPSFLVVSFLGFCCMPICCGESVQNSSPTRVPTNQPRSARRLCASLGRAENSRRKRLLATLPSVFLLDFLLVVPDIKVISQSSIPALFFLFFGSSVDLSFLFNFDQGNAFLELRARSVGASIMS